MSSIIYSITGEELQTILNTSKTYGQVLKHFGLENKGANAKTLKRRIKEENLRDTNILKGFKFGGGWNKGTKGVYLKRMSLEDAMKTIFISNFQGYPASAKKYVRMYHLIDEKCFDCGLRQVWNNKPITLELEHVDGNSHNNDLSNLKWLCPNCHSQTPTFRGRNRRIRHHCIDCKKEIVKGSARCAKCDSKRKIGQHRKVEWPSKAELEAFVNTMSLSKVGKKFGVSHTAVKKWCKSLGVSRPNFNRGYWLKKMVRPAGFEPAVRSNPDRLKVCSLRPDLGTSASN